MAEVVLGAVLEELLSKVISLGTEQINLVWGFKEDLQKLRDILDIIQAFLQGADKRQIMNDSVKRWLKKLEGVAYEAVDVLDEFAYELLRQKVEIGDQKMKKLLDFFSSSNPIAFRHKMANKIKGIHKSFDDLNKLANQLGLQQIRAISNITPVSGEPNIETAASMGDTKIVGRESDASKVVEMLMRSSNEQIISVVPIVGMAGLGKTTLARLVYNNAERTRQFDMKFWVCVSNDFDDKRILKQMLEHFIDEQISAVENKNAMVEQLRSKLKGKKFLLVLDDVWKVEQCDDLMLCLGGINDKKGNALIITTRDELVASKVQTLPDLVHNPRRLDHDECWSIIKAKAFGYSPISEELESTGKNIARRCKGVPLVAKVIGGTMRNERVVDAWLNIQKTVVWDSIENVLRLSFDRLPSPHLKKCFAYCAIFPKDFLIEKEQLIQLWMAEGLLQQPPGSALTMEEVGGKYFNVLASSSLLQDLEKDNFGNIINCKMHDLASSVSKPETLILDGGSTSMGDISHIRHLNIIDGRISLKTISTSVPKLHSLFLGNYTFYKSSNLTCLRILKICRAYGVVKFPDSLGKLKHLRYFDISKTSIGALPHSITKLYNLQTLRFIAMRRTLNFPNRLRNLINLKHVHFDHEANQPSKIGSLACLQTLPIFFVRFSRGHRIEELKCLNELVGSLRICYLQNVRDKDEAMGAELCKKSRLSKLSLEWSSGGYVNRQHEEVLENLQPHPKLQSLIVKDFRGWKLPSWMLQPIHGSSNNSFFLLNNLIELELVNCYYCTSLPPLGQLQNLKFLTLKNMDCVKCMGDDEIYCNALDYSRNEATTVFPALKRFTLAGMRNLEELTAKAPTVMFPCLEKLGIDDCPLLKSVQLMGQISFLEKLRITQCSNLRSIGDGLATSTLLKLLTIEGCSNLCSIPHLKGFSTLSSVYISGCEELEIVPLRGTYFSLEKLHIINCRKLSMIGDGSSTFVSLQELKVECCLNLSSIPIIDGSSSLRSVYIHNCNELKTLPLLGTCSSLQKLHVSGCKILSKIGNGLSTSTCLQELVLADCHNLSSLPNLALSSLHRLVVTSCPKLERLPIIGLLPSLEIFDVRDCEIISNIPDVLLALSTSLKYLSIQNCKHLTFLLRLDWFSSLQKLTIDQCPQLTIVPITGEFSSLRELIIRDCWKLSYVGNGMSTFSCLKKLIIKKCPNLRSTPVIDGLSSLTELEFIDVGEGSTCLLSNVLHSDSHLCKMTISGLPYLISMPQDLGKLHSLEDLTIMECPRLRSIPDDCLGSLTSLRKLKIGGFSEELEEFPGLISIQHLSAFLEDLHLIGWNSLESLPCQIQYLTALKILRIERFRGVKALPEWLRNFSNLNSIMISECPQLELRCIEKSGPEWSKISHIPNININEN